MQFPYMTVIIGSCNVAYSSNYQVITTPHQKITFEKIRKSVTFG